MKTLSAAFFLCGLATQLPAESITILNPNFDAQVLAPNASTGSGAGFNPITDWNQDDVTNTGYSVYNPVASSYPGGVPGGNNVADVFSDGTTATISQILSTNLQANDTYTLSGEAGYRLDTNIFGSGLDGCAGNASVEAGGNLESPVTIGGNVNNNGSGCTAGTFTNFSVTFTTGASPAGLGQPIEIILQTLGTGSVFEPTEVDFTDITLTDTAGSGSPGPPSSVPEPQTFVTLGTAMVCLGLWWRRRATGHRSVRRTQA